MNVYLNGIQGYLKEVEATLEALPLEQIARVVEVLLTANARGNTIFLLGNGGSSATASHFACDLAKGTIRPGRPRFRVIALTDNMPLVTAWSNDVAYADMFAEQLAGLIREDDVVMMFSGSGNSPNVLRAAELAHRMGGVTIGFTGFAGGKLSGMVDLSLVVPSTCMEQIEDVHLILCHLIATALRQQPEAEVISSLPLAAS